MAKLECTLQGDYDKALEYFHNGILEGSASDSFEEERYFQRAGVRVTLTLVGDGKELHLSGITAGGSQGVLLKFNTWGEKAFLDKLYALVQRWE